MYAIETYFVPPTNTRGSRIKARVMEGRTADGGPARSITLPWDHALGTFENHGAAAHALAAKLDWQGTWTSAGGPDGSCIWVNMDKPSVRPVFHYAPEADQ